jgi:hypothetical protein
LAKRDGWFSVQIKKLEYQVKQMVHNAYPTRLQLLHILQALSSLKPGHGTRKNHNINFLKNLNMDLMEALTLLTKVKKVCSELAWRHCGKTMKNLGQHSQAPVSHVNTGPPP